VKIQADVKRAEQSFDFDTNQTLSFLVLEAFGVELRIPVTDEQLQGLIAQQALEEGEDVAQAFSEPTEPRRPPATFVGPVAAYNGDQDSEDLGFIEAPQRPASVMAPARRELRPMARVEGSDDAGIAQG
jgi:hypothetical protein